LPADEFGEGLPDTEAFLQINLHQVLRVVGGDLIDFVFISYLLLGVI
jgi:hypothetical protein